MSEIASAIEALYEAFKDYNLKPKIDTRTCGCVRKGWERALHRRPLRKLTWKELSPFFKKAMTTFGDRNDSKHFLPRIMELQFSSYGAAPWGFELLFDKLYHGFWWTWPMQERSAIFRLLVAWQDSFAMGEEGTADRIWRLEELQAQMPSTWGSPPASWYTRESQR